MADNVPISAGTGTNIATDDIAGVHYQIVKQAFGVADAVPTPTSQVNPLPVGGALVSTANSTTTALAANGVFTGTSEDISQYASITVTLHSSAASATDGLSMQQSTDGTNWDVTDVFTIPANTGKTFAVHIVAKFWRVVYTNGAAAQTTFRLQSIFHNIMQGTSSQRPQDGRGNDNDFQETLSYLMGYNPTANDWHRLRTTGGTLQVSPIAVPLVVTNTAAAGTAVTTTVPAAGAGLFHYITKIVITKVSSTTAGAAAAPFVITTTNLPGSLAFTTPSAIVAGGIWEGIYDYVSPLKSSAANTATTIVAALHGNIVTRITVYYYTGQ